MYQTVKLNNDQQKENANNTIPEFNNNEKVLTVSFPSNYYNLKEEINLSNQEITKMNEIKDKLFSSDSVAFSFSEEINSQEFSTLEDAKGSKQTIEYRILNEASLNNNQKKTGNISLQFQFQKYLDYL